MSRDRRIGWGIAGVVVIAVLGFGARAATGVLVSASDDIPTGTVTRGTLKADLITTGEIKADEDRHPRRSRRPARALRILTLLPAGTRVKKGDTVVTFDPTDQEKTVEEQRSVLREAQLEIARTLATTASRQAQDDLDLQTARFDLRKAELDVQASEVRPPLDARKAQLTLEEVRNRLAQLEGDRASRSQSDQAALAVAREKETKAQLAIKVATTILSQMVLRASMDGVVSVKDNMNISFGYQGMTLNEYRVGDQVQAGAPIAEVLDLGQLEIGADIDENDRARLAVGQSATLTLDALGGRVGAGEGQRRSARSCRSGSSAPARRVRRGCSRRRWRWPARPPISGRGSPGASRSAARRRWACCTSRAAPCSSATAARWSSCAAAAAAARRRLHADAGQGARQDRDLGGRRGRGRGHRRWRSPIRRGAARRPRRRPRRGPAMPAAAPAGGRR